MARKPVLVVMAAGMGSRYGGLKQIDPVGSHGEALLDFSLYDAWQAGFETAVIIIKEAIRNDFMSIVAPRLEKCPLEIKYAYQELDKIPEGFSVPDGRTKPWGTTHAVLCAREAIGDNPFVVLNADDFYGRTAFRAAYNWLKQQMAKYETALGKEKGCSAYDFIKIVRDTKMIYCDFKLALRFCAGNRKLVSALFERA